MGKWVGGWVSRYRNWVSEGRGLGAGLLWELGLDKGRVRVGLGGKVTG